MTELTVQLTRIINAPIEQVFDAWLDPETLARFILPMPGMPQPEVTNDACEGGGFTIIMQVGEDRIAHTGKYLEIIRPERLVFTWESPFSPAGSRVTLLFSAEAESRTRIDLTHVKFFDEQTRTDHEGGWGNILASLDDLLVRRMSTSGCC